MKELTCIIIEDQQAAQRLLKEYMSQTPGLKLEGIFINPLEALPAIEKNTPDILFLDIQLPKLSGLELLKAMPSIPNVILTTAFPDYAVEGFNLDVTDYLLKPFSFERFLRAVAKVNRNLKDHELLKNRNEVFLKDKGIFVKVKISDILYIESKGDFALLVTSKKKFIVDFPLKSIRTLFGERFMRCHKSYVVNIPNIEQINGNLIQMSAHSIPIGRTYKLGLLEYLGLL